MKSLTVILIISLFCLAVEASAKTPVPNAVEYDMKTIAMAVVVFQKHTKTIPIGDSAAIARELVDEGCIKPGKQGFSRERGFFSPDGIAYLIFVNEEGVCVTLPGSEWEPRECYVALFDKGAIETKR